MDKAAVFTVKLSGYARALPTGTVSHGHPADGAGAELMDMARAGSGFVLLAA